MMHYRVAGKGVNVMLMHGFIEEGSMWNDLAKTLARSYRVIIPDLPGFGKSADVSLPDDLSMDWYAEQVYQILQKEKVKRVVMLGHSMGGYVTLHFAEKHGDMLTAFGLINSHCFADGAEKKENRKKGIEFVKKHGAKVFIKELYGAIFHDDYKKKHRKQVDAMVAVAQHYPDDAIMKANAAMMNRTDKSDVLKQAKVPVLMIGGKEDMTVPLELMLKQAAYPAITDLHIYSNSKHMTVFERKKEATQAVKEFLGRV